MKQVLLTVALGAAMLLPAAPAALSQSAPSVEQKRPGAEAGAPAGRKRGEGGEWRGKRGGGPPGGAPSGDAQGKGPGGPPGGSNARSGARGGPPGGRPGGRGGRPAFVTLDSVIQGPLAETVPIFGRLVARQMGVVAARIAGPVAGVRAFVGDRVKKGDILVELATDTLRAQQELQAAELQEYRARVQSASAQVGLIRQEVKRFERLRRSPAFSQARYDDKLQELTRVRSVLLEARAKVRQAQAELRKAEINLNNAMVRAPFDGTVSERHTDVGAYLGMGAKVVTLINDTALEVEAEVPSIRLNGLSPGSVVRTEFEDGESFLSAVRAVVPLENALARTRTVRFAPRFDRSGKVVAVNQSVRLMIPVGAPRDVVSVHKDAVLQRGGRTVVYIAVDKKAMIRPVRLGDAVGGRFVVLSGLEPGDKVVVRGNERLRPGQTIRVRGNGGPPGGPPGGRRNGRRGPV